ncbi:c-type cytochrome [Cognatishimia activa]|jgi:mono/diheme cytochrome c family protein|uniref:Cytochrome c n=2 Tax=Cognatishimia TaxID=2211635 RepID=A0A975ESM5_9RHOB|nr:cytochrome c [Cognatishimia activa]QTN36366.1 cytochrome c [Cognatishimia activa]
MRYSVVIFIMAVAAGGAWFWSGPEQLSARAAGSGAGDIVAGEQIYAEYCAACHGANLEGQENWRSSGADGRLPAPPHDETGHTWHHPDSLLFDYTKLGGKALMATKGIEFDSGMPGFADQLTDAEIHNVLAYIKSTWPERIQKIQAERSEAEEQQD